jgi:hypothetical protein
MSICREALPGRLRRILSDGRWHSTAQISSRLRLEVAVFRFELQNVEGVAESDSGKYFCIPTEKTPLYAPDEHPAGNRAHRKPSDRVSA